MHVILDNAKVYPVSRSITTPEGYQYDESSGFWCSETTGEPMIYEKNPNPPTSKKCDIETGEDQKGE